MHYPSHRLSIFGQIEYGDCPRSLVKNIFFYFLASKGSQNSPHSFSMPVYVYTIDRLNETIIDFLINIELSPTTKFSSLC